MSDETRPRTMSEVDEASCRLVVDTLGLDAEPVCLHESAEAFEKELDAERAAHDATRAKLAEVERERDEARDANAKWQMDALLAQAEARDLREALLAAHRAAEAAQEATDIEGQSDESALDAYEEGTCAVLRATTPALLSRAPGSRAALRAMLTEAAEAGLSQSPNGFSERQVTAIVARLLGEEGASDAE